MDIGARLRTSREAQGMSLAVLAQKTRVPPRILSAIEVNDLRSIPPKPYGRGFVRAYAVEVGLDPDQTVQAYFGQFAPAISPAAESSPPLNESPRSGWVVAAAALALAVVGSLFLFGGGPAVGDEATDETAVGTAGASNPQPGDASGRGVADVQGTPDAAVSSEGRVPAELTVTVHADRPCWVAATADGRRAIYQLMPAGSQQTVRAAREVAIRAGDAGALRVILNGRDTGVLGTAGEVRNARITPETAASFGSGPPPGD